MPSAPSPVPPAATRTATQFDSQQLYETCSADPRPGGEQSHGRRASEGQNPSPYQEDMCASVAAPWRERPGSGTPAWRPGGPAPCSGAGAPAQRSLCCPKPEPFRTPPAPPRTLCSGISLPLQTLHFVCPLGSSSSFKTQLGCHLLWEPLASLPSSGSWLFPLLLRLAAVRWLIPGIYQTPATLPAGL